MKRKFHLEIALLGIVSIISLVSISGLGHALADVTTPPNFIIFKNGTNYQLKNGTSGVIIATNSNASYIVQIAQNNLPSTTYCLHTKANQTSCGGTILFKEGTYPVHIIVTHAGTRFIGDGLKSTILKREEPNQNKNIFYIYSPTTAHAISAIEIKDLSINGGNYTASDATDCVFANQTSHLLIQRVWITNCYGNGIYAEQLWESVITHNFFNADAGRNGNEAQSKA